MNFFHALKASSFAEKLSEAAGFDFNAALASGDVNALKTLIESVATEAKAGAAKPATDAAAQIATLTTALESATAENAKISAENKTLAGTFAAAGITLPAAVEGADQIAANKAALESHIKIAASGVLAKTGHTAIENVVTAPRLTGRQLLVASISASIAKLKAQS